MKRCLALLAFVIAQGSVAQPSESSRKVDFTGGFAVITNRGGGEGVEIHDENGKRLSSSICGSEGVYDRIVAFFKVLKATLAEHDPRAVASLMEYPLRVNYGHKMSRYIENERAFLAQYSDIITPKVIARISHGEPHDVFCKDGMATFARGVMWIGGSGEQFKVVVVNRGPR
jgi:hypothetical protein